MSLKKCQLSIWREDPGGRGLYMQRFLVPYDPTWSVLQALEYLSDELDPSLAYRSSCQIGRCGVCKMIINGKLRFACRESLTEKLEIRAWRPRDVVRDLVVRERQGRQGNRKDFTSRTESINGGEIRRKEDIKPR